MSQDRQTLGERLANRLSSRSRRRPRMALDASFYARFGLEDPWSSPEIDAQAESGDGMVFLSGAPFYSMMRRLGAARRRRERRQERFFKRRAGTTMRAASRRWAGEAEGVVQTHRLPAFSPDAFVLPEAAAATATESVPTEPVALARAPYQAMRPVKSAWHTTPFVPARVIRGGAARTAGDAESSEADRPSIRAAVRPMQRVGDRLRAADVESTATIRVAGQLPARVRRAILTVIADELPAEMTVVEVVRILRRMGAPASVIREVVEVAPETSATAVAARRMPTNPASSRGAGLRPALSRSPAMALASSADADHAASGTLADAERSDVRTGIERPRRSMTRPAVRVGARASSPAASAALSASPVSRVSAGRPAALRAAPVVNEAGAGPEQAPSRRRSGVVRRLKGGTFVGVERSARSEWAAEAAPFEADRSSRPLRFPAAARRDAHGFVEDPEQQDRPRPATAHAVARAALPAVPPRARSIARSDGMAWAYVRGEAPEGTEAESVIPAAVPALRRPASAPRLSAARPVQATAGRFVTARLAAATGALAGPMQQRPGSRSARTGSGPTATALPAPTRSTRPRTTRATPVDQAHVALALPAAGASPIQQAMARLGAASESPETPTSSVVPHATPRLDRPVRRAQVLPADAFLPVAPLAPESGPLLGRTDTPEAATAMPRAKSTTGVPARQPGAVAQQADRTIAISGRGQVPAISGVATRAARRAESPSRAAVSRVAGLRVSTSEVVRAVADAAPEVGVGASGPMAWTPQIRYSRSPVITSRAIARRGRTLAPQVLVDRADLAATPVRDPAGRFLAARQVPSEGPVSVPGLRGLARTAQPGVARFMVGAGGRVNVVYVSPESFTPAVGNAVENVAQATTAPSQHRPVRSLAWAGARTNVSAATAYRGAIGDGGLPLPERATISGFDPGVRRSRAADRSLGTVLAADREIPATTAGAGPAAPTAPSRREARSALSRPAVRDRAGRAAPLAPPRRATALGNDAFVAPATFGFDGPDIAPAGGAAAARVAGPETVADGTPGRPTARRLPLDRRLHGMATGGGSDSGGTSPVWTARSDGAPLVRSVHGLFESLARATTAEQVVHVLFARADGLLSAPAGISAPIQQVISEIRQEVSRTPAAATSDEATLPTRPSRLAAPQAEPLRPQGPRPTSTTRVMRGSVRPVASRASGIRSGSEDRIMGLVKKLQGLIHLAEAEHRLAEAQRQVRMAEDSHEARGEGGQGTRGPGQAGGSQDGSKMDIEQLGREVLDVVSRELEYRRERRMEDHDESIWW